MESVFHSQIFCPRVTLVYALKDQPMYLKRRWAVFMQKQTKVVNFLETRSVELFSKYNFEK